MLEKNKIQGAIFKAFEEDSRLSDYNGYLLISQNHVPVFEGAFGYANFTDKRQCDKDTIFCLGSLTKSFTALGIMILMEQGLIRLTDPIIKFLPDLQNHEGLCVEHLLYQISGLPDYWNAIGIAHIDKTDMREIYEFIKRQHPVEEPGQRFQYCNTNYILCGFIIEAVSGASYPDFISEKIISPVGMKRSGFISHTMPLYNVATGHIRRRYEPLIKPCDNLQTDSFSAGAMYSTPRDLSLFDAALDENILCKEETKKKIWDNSSGRGYGAGWFISENTVYHGGDLVGFSVRYTKYINDNITVIALNNIDGRPESHMGHYSEIIERCILG